MNCIVHTNVRTCIRFTGIQGKPYDPDIAWLFRELGPWQHSPEILNCNMCDFELTSVADLTTIYDVTVFNARCDGKRSPAVCAAFYNFEGSHFIAASRGVLFVYCLNRCFGRIKQSKRAYFYRQRHECTRWSTVELSQDRARLHRRSSKVQRGRVQ